MAEKSHILASPADITIQNERAQASYNYFPPSDTPPVLENTLLALDKPVQGLEVVGVFENLAGQFGFQRSSMRNQKEHLALLISNNRLRYGPDQAPDVAITDLHRRVFRNYVRWCKFLREKPCFPGGKPRQEAHLALFFLIWGEAANLRFMPECLCFLYHKLAHRLADQAVSAPGPALSDGEGSFLRLVVRPIYEQILTMRTMNSSGTKIDHQDIRNYDDINEFFWTRECLKLNELNVSSKLEGKRNKTFREKRSLFNPFLAFYRIYKFLLMALHLLIVIAYVAYRGDPNDRMGFGFYENFFISRNAELRRHAFSSVFMTIAGLSLLEDLLRIWLEEIRLFLDTFSAFGLLFRILWNGLFSGFFACVTASPKSEVFGQSYLDLAPFGILIYAGPLLLAFLANAFFPRHLRRSFFGRLLGYSSLEYTGRETRQPWSSYRKYALFWLLVYMCKFLFNLQLMIVPLIGPSVEIWQIGSAMAGVDDRVKGPFESENNIFLLIMLWLPVVCVYLYDTQIWFALFQSLLGMVNGIRLRVGQSNRPSEFLDRLRTAPELFDRSVVSQYAQSLNVMRSEAHGSSTTSSTEQCRLRFSVVWNECISSFRLLDLVDDREASILQYSIEQNGSIEDPVFAFAGKAAQATEIASKSSKASFHALYKKLDKQGLLPCIRACFELSVQVLSKLLGPEDEGIIRIFEAFAEPEYLHNIQQHLHLEYFPAIREQLADVLASVLELPEIAESSSGKMQYHDHNQVMSVVQQMVLFLETMEKACVDPNHVNVLRNSVFTHVSSNIEYQKKCVHHFFSDTVAMNMCTRLFLLLTLDLADALPRCAEAQRRISFFLQSLSMEMPKVQSVPSMNSFSVVTPYYNETVLYSLEELLSTVHSSPLFKAVEEAGRNELSILKYLSTCHPDEWGNFLERIGVPTMEEAIAVAPVEVRLWASNRGQTLARTVQGMMLYEDAIKMLRWLEVGGDQRMQHEEKLKEMNQIVNLKFSYITSCQMFGKQRRMGDPRAADIEFLMHKYPNWRVAYVDEVPVQSNDGNMHFNRYDAVLIKSEADQIVEVYRYELPGAPIVGEGKPENQNIGIQFTRGEYLQTIDMNQEHYFEETLKIPNFLATATNGVDASGRDIVILGMKEHIFTARASSLARFMTLQELVFVSLTQRVLADPLEVRMHYGHPDVFDKLFAMSNGSVSKASRGINLSEDVFSGYNFTLRGGRITHHEFILCGKGRDVTLSQINQFEAKLANGCAESSLSREGHRLGKHLDFPRLNSVYYGHMGFYLSNFLTVVCVFLYAYSKVYVGLHSSTEYYLVTSTTSLDSLAAVLNTQFIFQFGMILTIPLFATLITEKGVRNAILHIIEMFLTLGPVFYIFETGTKSHFFDVAMLRGGSKYRGTGRSFMITREQFVNFFKEYAASHYRKGVELLALMVIFGIYGKFDVGKNVREEWCKDHDCTQEALPQNITLLHEYSSQGQSYGVASFAVYLLSVCFLLSPFVFNTDGLDFAKSRVDVKNWIDWMFGFRPSTDSAPLINNPSDNDQLSWTEWWASEISGRTSLTWTGRMALFLREVRHFFIMAYIFYVDYDMKHLVYLAATIVGLILVLTIIGYCGQLGRKCTSPLTRAILYCAFLTLSVVATAGTILLLDDSFNLRDICSFAIAVLAGSYGLLQYILAMDGIFDVSSWHCVQQLAFHFDFLFGIIITCPLILLSSIPFMSILQTRMMYNDGFSKALSTSGEFAASLCLLTGIVGGFGVGWLTCLVYSLGFVNDPREGFQNESFVYFLDQILKVSNSVDYRDLMDVKAASCAILGVLIAAVWLRYGGRRFSIFLSSGVAITGCGLVAIESQDIIVIALCVVAAGIAATTLSILMYNYEITTIEWKGKSCLTFILGATLGFYVESILLYTINFEALDNNWANAPKNDWKYQFFYGAVPLVVLALICFWIPESPVWLFMYRKDKGRAAEAVLIRLRRKHDVLDDLEAMEKDCAPVKQSFFSTQFPRLFLVAVLQSAYAVLTSNAMLRRIFVRTREFGPGEQASPWHKHYGIITLFGVVFSMFSVDQVRRKTILKNFLPFVVVVSFVAGLLEFFELEEADQVIDFLLYVVFFAASMSVASVTWLSSIEMVNPRSRVWFTTFSFVVYYGVQACVFATSPTFATAHFVFGALCCVVVVALFTFFASTKDGTIRLKSEKNREKLEEEDEIEDYRMSRSSRTSSRRSHVRLRGISARSSLSQGGTTPTEAQLQYENFVTPQSNDESVPFASDGKVAV